jgi:hypothetical protein
MLLPGVALHRGPQAEEIDVDVECLERIIARRVSLTYSCAGNRSRSYRGLSFKLNVNVATQACADRSKGGGYPGLRAGVNLQPIAEPKRHHWRHCHSRADNRIPFFILFLGPSPP